MQCDDNHCLNYVLIECAKKPWDGWSEGFIVPCMSVTLVSIISVLPCFLMAAKLFASFLQKVSYRPLTKMPPRAQKLDIHPSSLISVTYGNCLDQNVSTKIRSIGQNCNFPVILLKPFPLCLTGCVPFKVFFNLMW